MLPSRRFGAAILLCLWLSAPALSQRILCKGDCSHDQSASIYTPSAPTTLNPEFALRLAAALAHAKDEGLLSKAELDYITSSFRSKEDQERLRSQYLADPTKFPHAPAARTIHSAGLAGDLGNIDPFASPDLIPALVVALEREGLYFPLLEDPVHVEVHPTSQLVQDAEFGYFARYGQMAPPRLPYVDQLQVLQTAATSMRPRLEDLSRDITLNANATRMINKFLSDLNHAEVAGKLNEDFATTLMAPLIGDMYALYRARSFPSSIPLRDAVRFLSLYKSLGKDFSSARLPLSEVASLSRRQDATAKLQGWILLRPNPSGTSSVIQRSDARWEGFTLVHPELWRGGASSSQMLRDGVRSERGQVSSKPEGHASEGHVSNDGNMHWTMQNGNGPVRDAGPATAQPPPVEVPKKK